MTGYIGFKDPETHEEVLVEIDDAQVGSSTGLAKAGVKEAIGNVLGQATNGLTNSISRILQANADAFFRSIEALPHPPSTAEITFSLKATGEIGNFVVSKLSAEGNYAVKLTWKLTKD